METLSNRVEDLMLPAFLKRVIEYHPWVKMKMNQTKNNGNGGKGAKQGGGGGGGGGGSGSGSGSPGKGGGNDREVYGDLGSALILEAELFDSMDKTYVRVSTLQSPPHDHTPLTTYY